MLGYYLENAVQTFGSMKNSVSLEIPKGLDASFVKPQPYADKSFDKFRFMHWHVWLVKKFHPVNNLNYEFLES